MGRDSKYIRIVASVSRHNSEQDRKDDAALENLYMEIVALVNSDPEYARVVQFVDGP